jgi:hypothetical protein
MLDLVSDVVIITEYISTDRLEFAYLLIGLVAANILYQLLIVWMQTRSLKKNKRRVMLMEMSATVLFIKPGLDAWKVASGAEQLSGAVVSPLHEMNYSKAGEMVFESVPGLVLQSVAILRAKERSTVAVVSLLISAASTGLTATTMFYDNDVEPGTRKRNPVWCGVIPDQGRGLAFATVFTFCTLHALAKGVATALLYIANPLFLMIYFAVDYCLFFTYLAARSDVVFYVPMPPTASWIISPIFRIMFKIQADFGGSPVMRLPLFLGGRYYIFNLISAQASVLIAVYLYTIDREKSEADNMWLMATALVVFWCAVMTFFLARIANPTHRHTFWSSVSGRQCVHEYYTKGAADEDKLKIFGCNRLLWESDIRSEVMEFTLQNWTGWERDKPAWFTQKLKATVPDDYIPKESLAGLGGANRMRRGSAAESVRESFRMLKMEVAEEEEEEEEEIEAVNCEEEIEEIKADGDVDFGEKVKVNKDDIYEDGDKEALMEEGVSEDIMNEVD